MGMQICRQSSADGESRDHSPEHRAIEQGEDDDKQEDCSLQANTLPTTATPAKRKVSETSFVTQSTETTPTKMTSPEANNEHPEHTKYFGP